MIEIEIENRSGAAVDEQAAASLARKVLEAEGVVEGELGLSFVGGEEIRALKREHLAIDEVTDVLSFPQVVGEQLRPAFHASSVMSSSAPRWWGPSGENHSYTASCTCSATSTGPRWRSGRTATNRHEPTFTNLAHR